MSDSIEDPGHGHSPAAWTAIIIMLVAIAAGTLFYVIDVPIAVWACVALLVVGLIAGWALSKAGYGVNGPKYTPKQH
ncbi:DUF6704 family protein [Microbacterium sp.]|uniref:DUF6704 family protein n=1 Tax=Microbacterium sp. TaxID=51671 RepID=UPI0039E3E221